MVNDLIECSLPVSVLRADHMELRVLHITSQTYVGKHPQKIILHT
jgi:hypothetical protein